jgi:hypothetical protein
MAALSREHFADTQAERLRHGALDIGNRYASRVGLHGYIPPVVDMSRRVT